MRQCYRTLRRSSALLVLPLILGGAPLRATCKQ